MNYIETIVAISIFCFFCFSFTQSFVSLFSANAKANELYQNAKSIEFIDRSFRNVCKSASHDLVKWKKDITVVKNLESCEVSALESNGTVRAMKAECQINGEHIEIVAEYGNP